MSGNYSRRYSRYGDDYSRSRRASPSYGRSRYSYAADTYPRTTYTYVTDTYSRSRAASPVRYTSRASPAASPPPPYSPYPAGAQAPPPRDRTYTGSRPLSPLRTTGSTSRSRAFAPSPPRYGSYTAPGYGTPPRTTYTPRPYSPLETTPYRSTSSPTRRARSPVRARSRSRSRSRLSRFGKSLGSALDSVPREDLQDLGAEVGKFVADKLHWRDLDGRGTKEREGYDMHKNKKQYWGYSTQG
ncbi:hypothetical protein C8A00DRAFT_37536 [Chaetomidium leptoderma]|uniref:Uncharacterized protein n=1 Tax=Chaetomidium leptoderma TaxID=669021 RepID=A0AAN6VFG6_9PEZI|nr:hypothetical protein C8A00DRAFT_37536 [Chaetomidium leptoderma]